LKEEVTVKVCDLVTSDQRQANRKIADELEISFGSCQTILTKYLGMRYVSATNGC
jgi:hypothetical protein